MHLVIQMLKQLHVRWWIDLLDHEHLQYDFVIPVLATDRRTCLSPSAPNTRFWSYVLPERRSAAARVNGGT